MSNNRIVVQVFWGIVLAILVWPFGAQGQTAPTFQELTYASGLSTPTAMAFAPDGRLFVAEQSGKLRVIKNGTLLSASFLTVPVLTDGERGLLGVAFDPNFATNRFVYVYYTNSNPVENRVSRFTADPGNPDVALTNSEVVILGTIPSRSAYHNGGAIHFGIDGKLYVGVGEGRNSQDAQSLGTIAGKLLRITPDGSSPADNPFVSVGGARKEIWVLGLRNPFTFAIDPVSGKIHINDVGEVSWEEINLASKGANYGWPICEGFCSDSRFQNPLHAYDRSVGRAITGGTFYRGNQFPSQYQGVYFFADYLGNFIKQLNTANQVSDFRSAKSPVDLVVGLDGALYYASLFDGKIYKIQSGTGNSADLNADGRVDVIDLGILLSNWNSTAKPKADINQDGRVDVVDLGILLAKWGS